MIELALLAATSMSGAPGSTSASAAAIPTGSTPSAVDLEAPRRLRSGLAAGFSIGGSLVGASGYPNDSQKIGQSSFYSSGGLLAGTTESIFVMGALTDYLSFGFWYTHADASNSGWRSKADGGGLRVEVFPLVDLVPRLAGLGILGQFGVGGGNLYDRKAGVVSSEGTQSFLSAGVFHEWSFAHLLGGHLAAGPSLDYAAIWSQAFERHGLTVSGRIVFYGGP